VAEIGAVEFAQDELLDGLGREPREQDRVGRAGADLLVLGEMAWR